MGDVRRADRRGGGPLTISFGVNTFDALYWIRHLGSSPALGGLALTLELVGGVAGTLLGGRLGDRIGLVRTVQIGNALLVPALFTLLAYHHPIGALPLVLIVGLVNSIPFAVLVKLGQDYLPNRPGTAAGVTLGLAVSAGGLFMPILGLIADRHGPQRRVPRDGAHPVHRHRAIASSARTGRPGRAVFRGG
jgi:FSR family fosmidomycin resistance protein-like MFS transporter